MPGDEDKTSENPYEASRHRPDDFATRRRSQPLPWWARPDAPSILGALLMVFVVVVGVVISLLLPIIKWLCK